LNLEGGRVPFRPIREIGELYESLDDRVMAGFGGVAEYGITVRWNKNFLKVIRLLIERRREFGRWPSDGDPDEERARTRHTAGV
jgi:hypothetical protein